MTHWRIIPKVLAATSLLAALMFAHAGLAQTVNNDLPDVAKGIGVTQKLGDSLPMSLNFEDEQNRFIQFGQLFGDKPVVLSFNYSNCPKICVVQLQNLAAELQNIDLVPGQDFEIVSVSLDPNEQSSQLAETKKKYVTAYGDLDSADGWHFLRGTRENIGKLADACGFKYKYIPKERIYSHPAAFIFCTNDGRISRYLDGLDGGLDRSLKPALLEAGEGKIGSFADRVKYFAGCYVFDPSTGKYSLSAIRLMRLAAMATVVCIVIGVAPYWVRRKQNHSRNSTKDASTGIDHSDEQRNSSETIS